MKTREMIVKDLIEHAKILGEGAEDWQFIENITMMGKALIELDEDELND